jgi:hypothetical protein
MPTDYACVVLEEGKMLHLAWSDIICYSTNEYVEGYSRRKPRRLWPKWWSCGHLQWGTNTCFVASSSDHQGHRVHLATLLCCSYCPWCLPSKRFDCVSCAWVQRGIMIPKFIVIRFTSRFSQDYSALKHGIETCSYVLLSQSKYKDILTSPHLTSNTSKYQLQDDTSFFQEPPKAIGLDVVAS